MASPARAVIVALACATLVGCASRTEWVGRCQEGPRFAPDEACLAMPETLAIDERLAELIIAETDPIAVLVDFDEEGRVANVCAAHTLAPKQWDGQRELNARLPLIRSIPAGPACLAGRTFVYNELGAVIGGLRAQLEDCRSAAAGSMGLYDRLCLQTRQVQRGEVWFFNTERDYPYVFVPSGDDHKGGGLALDRCTEYEGVMPTQLPQVTIGYTRSHRRVTGCMEKLGWKQLL